METHNNLPLCTGPVCEHCHNQGCSTGCSCDKQCPERPCACPEPFIAIDKVPGKEASYRVNDNGKTTLWDLLPGIKAGQTDTSLVVDVIARLIRFTAERHTDTITAQELGSILHLADIGDVSTKGAEDGALLTYKKTDTCGNGCFGTGNTWEPWNALGEDEQAQSAKYAFGFNADGKAVSLQPPQYTDQYYNLGWNSDSQLSYMQPKVLGAPVLDPDGYAYRAYIHPKTKQLYYVKEKVQ